MKKSLLFCLLILITAITGCERKFGDYYDPPEGMEAEIYSQLLANPELSEFVKAVDRTPGLKDELSSSGLFTVMAPTNEAFAEYFRLHPEYASVENIPVNVLDPLVKYHIMRWMFFRPQFLASEFLKYETRSTVPSSVPGTNRNIYHTSKMFQVYTPNYRNVSRMTADDYSFVYGSNARFSDSQMNVMGASVLQADISAGNGACYVINRVIEPPLNIAQELETNYPEYNQFIQRYFVRYTFDRNATIAQGNNGDVNGDGMLDSLWVRSYLFGDAIVSDIDNENPRTINRGIVTYNTFTAYVPSKTAFDNYMQTKLLPSFRNNVDSIPQHTLALMYKAHISNALDWPSLVANGRAANSLGDNIVITSNDIVSTKMASNGLFYELNRTLEPRAFTAATGPSFFAPEYWYFAEMLVKSGYLNTFVGEQSKITVFAPTNKVFMDHNIFYLENPSNGRAPGFFRLNSNNDWDVIALTEINNIMGNHILLFDDLNSGHKPDGFYQAQNKSYVVVDQGNIYASEKDSVIQIIDPDHKMSNGTFHGINQLLFVPAYSLYNMVNRSQTPNPENPNPETPLINPQYYKFRELVIAAGIQRTDFQDVNLENGITAVSTSKRFTLLVPSNQAIIDAQNAGLLPPTGREKPEGTPDLTALEQKKLANYLRYFFIPEVDIFTDGKTSGTFNTQAPDPALSTASKPVPLKLSVSYAGREVTISNDQGEVGKVKMTEPVIQNMLAIDGVIQVVDNVFISRYTIY
ncbi:hypothetical protein AGMMS50239_38500 [Bacteroidia bacterium]|nr:hypothetical protein AGMMS50239_38500 [Bacteroidia bacterium]